MSSISRQVLNLEINYANFCGVRSIMLTGPARDASKDGGNQGLAQYSRAVQEALKIGNTLAFLVHMPMYREPVVGQENETLSSLCSQASASTSATKSIDLFSAWDSWHHIRSVCNYSLRLFVGMLANPCSHSYSTDALVQRSSCPRSCRKRTCKTDGSQSPCSI